MSKTCATCWTENENSATNCKSCGNILSDSFATEKPSSTPVLVMTDMDKKYGKVIRINNTCVIGRKGNVEPEFFAEDMYISEYHCKIILGNDGYRVEHLPTATNPTKINNAKLSKGISQSIRNGDYLSIADKKFEILLCDDAVCEDDTLDISTSNNNDSANDKIEYIITCPKCGFEYVVQNKDDRINECGNCGDDYDKYEISTIGAKEKYAD